MRLLLLLLFIPSVLVGQDRHIDELRKRLDAETRPPKRAALYNELSAAHFDLNFMEALNYANLALQEAERAGDKRQAGWARAFRGCSYFLMGSLAEARDELAKAKQVGDQVKDRSLQGFSLTLTGNTYRDAGLLDDAMQMYAQATQFLVADSTQADYWFVLKNGQARTLLQSGDLDEAKAVLSESMSASKRLNDSNNLKVTWILRGDYYRAVLNLDSAEYCLGVGRQLGHDDPVVEAGYQEGMGEVAFARGDFESAVVFWVEALRYRREYQYKFPLAHLLYRLGEGYEELGFYDLALEYLVQARTLAERCAFDLVDANVKYELAWVHYRARNLYQAETEIRDARNRFLALHQEEPVAGALNLIGLIYYQKKQYDSAELFLSQSLTMREAFGNKASISSSLFNMGDLFLSIGDPSKAMPYFNRGIKLDQEVGDQYSVGLYLNRMGKAMRQLNQSDSALRCFGLSLEHAIRSHSNELMRACYSDLADYYAGIGDYRRALGYQKQYTHLSDTVFNKQLAQSLASYRVLNEVETKEQQIQLLSKEKELTDATIREQRWLLIMAVTGGGILLVVAVSFFIFYRRLRKLNFEIGEQNEEIQAQAEELNEAHSTLSGLYDELASRNREVEQQAEELAARNEVVSQLNESLEIIVEERTAQLRKAYQELDTFFYRASHDFRRPLTTFMGLAEVAKITIKDPSALELFKKVNDTARHLDSMLHKLQSISSVGSQQLIVKEVLLNPLIADVLTKFESRIEEKGIHTEVIIEGKYSLHSYPALLGVIIENLVENAIEFSGSHHPFIRIRNTTHKERAVLEVEDNGIGINPEYKDKVFDMYFRASERSKGNGLGLYIVKKVLERMDGSISLETVEFKGTHVWVQIPNMKGD